MNTTQSVEKRVPRILVVDDMPDNLFLMNGLFGDRYRVIQAGSGQEALKIMMGSEPPDMVLLDIMMPDMDGYEVMRRIRQHPPTANVPIVFVTGLVTPQDERLGRELGAVDYVTKPIDPKLVIERIEAHVQATRHAQRVEWLSEKLARHLAPTSWRALFKGADAATIGFEQKVQSILYTEAASGEPVSDDERDAFAAEVEWFAMHHHGHVDRYQDAAGVVFFDDPAKCVNMAMDLQHSTRHLRLRSGVHTGPCEIAHFRSGNQVSCTLVGPETARAAKVAATAATGSIALSAHTYAATKDVIHANVHGDTGLAQACFTRAPTTHADEGESTFSGVGR